MLPPREYTENTQVTGGDEVLTGSPSLKKTKEELSLKDHGGDYLRRGMKGRRTNYDLAMA